MNQAKKKELNEMEVPYTLETDLNFNNRLSSLEDWQLATTKQISDVQVNVKLIQDAQSNYKHELEMFNRDVKETLRDNSASLLSEVQKIKDQEQSEKIGELMVILKKKEDEAQSNKSIIKGFMVSTILLFVGALIKYFLI